MRMLIKNLKSNPFFFAQLNLSFMEQHFIIRKLYSVQNQVVPWRSTCAHGRDKTLRATTVVTASDRRVTKKCRRRGMIISF